MTDAGEAGVELVVWAPTAERVAVDVRFGDGPWRTEAMRAKGDGWWERFEARPPAGSWLDYAFRVDGGDPTPDPRSPWQPHGVHRPSRWFDVRAHRWADATWAGPQHGAGTLGAVLYELHVGTFTPDGTLDSAADRLDELVELGVDVVELMPVAAVPGRWNWGYDGVDPYAVHEPYGGPAALQRFVDACHARGLGVCLDVVYNHLGPSGNYLSRFGPYFSDRHETPWGHGLNLDGEGSFHVRRWVVDNALRWFADFHVDALRLDAVHALVDDSPTHLLAQLSDEVGALAQRLGRPLALVAESDLNDPVMVRPTAQGGLGMTAQWDDDVHHALHVTLTGERQGYYADFDGHCPAMPEGGPLAVLAKTLTRGFLHDGCWSSFRHAMWGAPVEPGDLDGRRLVAYLQTHDQVGNRALGERISALVTPGQQAIGAAVYLTSCYTPMVFMGEEWAASTPFQFFTDFEDPELGRLVTEGRRREFASHGWAAEDVPDPQDEATYRRSQLDWGERQSGDHGRMLAWYRDLIALRRREPALTDGRLDLLRVDVDEEECWLVMARGDLRTVVNLAPDTGRHVPLDVEPREMLLAWAPEQTSARGRGLELPPLSCAVVRVDSP